MNKLMIIKLMVLSTLTSLGNLVDGFPNRIPTIDNLRSGYSESEPLILTPYIESNQIDKARMLSEVHLNGINLKSYSGFLTVDKRYASNMFFWFCPALSNKTDTPILVWLEGGPGGSSLDALLRLIGPLWIDSELKPSLNNYTWNEDFAMLFIDNPVGVGFSFTKNDSGMSNNEVEVAENLYQALEQFFTMFYEYQKNPFFITGESYGGKYVPAIAYKIHRMGEQARSKMNLQGMAIGNGWCDPIIQMQYGQFLYNIGLVDDNQRDYLIKWQNMAKSYIRKREFNKAAQFWEQLLLANLTGKGYLYNVSGSYNDHSFIEDNFSKNNSNVDERFLNLPETRRSIHVGQNQKYYDFSEDASRHLFNDTADSVRPWIEELLDAGYRMLFYQGQLDIIVATPLLEDFLFQLHWHGEREYRSAVRIIYRVDPSDQEVAGYVRQARNLYFIMVRNAEHVVPRSQPRVAKDLIKRFIRNESFVN